MENRTFNNNKNQQDINLKSFFLKIYRYKYFYILSIVAFVALTFLYIKFATPTYEVSTSILIDPSGSNRVLGESQYIQGGVSLIEMEKNLYNEIGIIKSFNLIKQCVDKLDFDITYHYDTGIKMKEAYGYFPFEVKLLNTESQIYDIPFEVEILSDNTYRLSIEADDFIFFNPTYNSINKIEYPINFSQEYSFGDTVRNEYFNFIIDRPGYKVNEQDFKNQQLSFAVHDLNSVTQGYLDKLEVNNIDIQASIFNIVSYGELVSKEVEFLNKVTENYIQNKLKSRNNIASAKEKFIRDQLNIVTDSLYRFESNLEMFKKNERAVDLSKSATNALESTQNLQTTRAKINLEIKYFKSLINDIEANRNKDDFIIPTSMGITNTLINQNIIALNELYSEKSKKKYYVTDNNQEMTILNEQINASTEKLLGNLRNAVKSSEIEARAINASLSSYDQEISTLPTMEKQLLSIERQSTLYENLFNYLSQELAKTGIARAESTTDTRILDEARMVGNGPVAPQKLLLLTLAVILGILFPMVWTMFSSGNKIENVEQITANSQFPIVGKIIHFDKKAAKLKGSLNLWKVKESFRDLSANLQLNKFHKNNVIGITSIMPTEGKTFCAINLGITFAEKGERTIIVDTDLRNPSIAKVNDKTLGYVLNNYLKGEASIDDVTHTHETLNNLKFIPTSVCKGNIHELLSSSLMKSLILNLKKSYDIVILDTPAVGLVSDFILLSEFIDINLIVVRRNAKLKYLNDINELGLRDRKNSFIIFNDVLKKDYKYGYNDKYGRNNEQQLVSDILTANETERKTKAI